MLATQPLALISVTEGRASELFWISMDGDAETCNPQAFINAFPEISCSVVPGICSGTPKQLADLVVERIEAADVCLVESRELVGFMRDEDTFRRIRAAAIGRLP